MPEICSLIGNLLCTDSFTRRKDRISYAKVFIEVDVAKKLPREVIIHMPNGSIRDQHFSYENPPKYCTDYSMLGHSLLGCKKRQSSKDQPTEEAGKELNSNSTTGKAKAPV